MIVASNISLTKNGREILKSADVDIRPGLFTAMAGPNGAGKSSFLKIVSGETLNYNGKVSINGRPLKEYPTHALAKIRAVLPQNTHLQFPFTVLQVIEMGSQYGKRPKAADKPMLEEVMDLTGTQDLRGRNYLTLSGGEQQRVQLARVMLQVWPEQDFPRYILLDEPTSSLDIARQQLIFSLVKKVCARNIGVLAIVHDLNQVSQFADQLYLLKDGSIVAQGSPKEIFTKPIIEETFCCRVNVYNDPCTNCPYIVPDNELNILSPITIPQ